MEKETIEESQELKEEGAAPTTQASPFVHEEIEHVREGKHGARSTKQAIAIGLSKARRAGVKLPTPPRGRVSEQTRVRRERDAARRTKAEPEARAGGPRRAETRGPGRCIAAGPLAPGASRVTCTGTPSALGECAQSGPDEGRRRSEHGCRKGGAYAEAPRQLASRLPLDRFRSQKSDLAERMQVRNDAIRVY